MSTSSVPHNHVAIIGTGFGGIATAVRLRKAGFDDLVLLDRADHVGGVWRDNDYPGAAVDVQSHLYSFSFAPNPDWRSTFAKQPELHAYLQRVTDQVDPSRAIDIYLAEAPLADRLTAAGVPAELIFEQEPGTQAPTYRVASQPGERCG
jgi:cation diffusion facilitator CzcD-associated flavoprotein CzcO